MTITAQQKHKLKKFIKELEACKAAHTEFVTVYIPQGYDINKITTHLAQEQGTAANIKSAATRKNVIDALERMIQHLKLFPQTPPNGLAVFAGNVLAREGKSDVKVWSIEPPVPLKTRIYKCDKLFEVDLLKELLAIKEMYGLVVLDRRDASVALLKGKTIVPLLKTHSHVPGKMKAGGQSAHRFEQNRALALKDHMKKVADYMKDEFLMREGVKGIIVGGPGPTKHELVDGNFLTGDIKKKIIGVKDLSYTEEFGLQELVDRSEDILAKEEIVDEKKVMARFFEGLAKDPDKVSYGEKEVKKALNMGAVDVLLISESLSDELIDDFDELAKKFSTEVKIISTETREGVQLRDLGGVAALLRYKLAA
ncbi:peptide chain release factor aRF-1 [Candidatus Woesearchaeota archaeon]|nr:peptide chain release factor aRF-1 [Candidatus Woesearchaeota archaeon]MBW2994076.1 peptide chain release factor aRF-1 [Candidatus Woesearchaeota archaeon]